MRKPAKKLMSLVMSAVMAASISSISVSADELNGVTQSPHYLSTLVSDTATYGNYIPSNVWNLSSSGMYNFNGQANGQAALYTNYLFTGVNSLAISVKNNHNTELKVKVRRRYSIGSMPASSTVTTFTVNKNSTVSKSVSVNANYKYYLEFSSPSNFNGYIA